MSYREKIESEISLLCITTSKYSSEVGQIAGWAWSFPLCSQLEVMWHQAAKTQWQDLEAINEKAFKTASTPTWNLLFFLRKILHQRPQLLQGKSWHTGIAISTYGVQEFELRVGHQYSLKYPGDKCHRKFQCRQTPVALVSLQLW